MADTAILTLTCLAAVDAVLSTVTNLEQEMRMHAHTNACGHMFPSSYKIIMSAVCKPTCGVRQHTNLTSSISHTLHKDLP